MWSTVDRLAWSNQQNQATKGSTEPNSWVPVKVGGWVQWRTMEYISVYSCRKYSTDNCRSALERVFASVPLLVVAGSARSCNKESYTARTSPPAQNAWDRALRNYYLRLDSAYTVKTNVPWFKLGYLPSHFHPISHSEVLLNLNEHRLRT